MASHPVIAKRIYDDSSDDDGVRVLVDRVWPRGISKERAHLDEWCKDVAPSTELRKWYGHDPQKYQLFRERYRAELAEGHGAEALAHLRELNLTSRLTLLTGSKALDISQAAVLVDLIS